MEMDQNRERRNKTLEIVHILWMCWVPRADERDLKCSPSLLYVPVTQAASERNTKTSQKYFSNFDLSKYIYHTDFFLGGGGFHGNCCIQVHLPFGCELYMLMLLVTAKAFTLRRTEERLLWSSLFKDRSQERDESGV